MNINIINFKEGKTFLATDSPVVNDKDYCETLTTPNILTYEYDGVRCKASGVGKSKETLIQEAINSVLFNEWFYELHYDDTFEDVGLNAPFVYDHEEDGYYEVNSISNYIDNCKNDDNYDNVIKKIIKLAKNEINIKIVEGIK